MGIKDFFFKGVKTSRLLDKKIYIDEIGNSIRYKQYAIQVCISKIANALSRCEFQTLEYSEAVKKSNWYLFNIEPNLNQNPSGFWNKVIYEMIYNPEGALIIQTDTGDLLVADSYTVNEYATKENIYTHVMTKGYVWQRSFLESDVYRLKHNNSEIKRVIDGVYEDYGKLIAGTIRNYNRSNAMKLVVKIGTLFDQFKGKNKDEDSGEDDYDRTLDELFKARLKALFGDSDTATPLEEGLNVEDLNASGNSKSSGSAANKTTRDITAMFDDIINLTADAFGIPRGILKGDVADAEAITDNFIAFCVNVWAQNIEDEFNRKMYKKERVLKGTKLKILTDTIKTYDPIKFANSAEALYRVRAVNANWIRRKIGEEEINEEWANEYVLTKNYEVKSNSKGGENKNE